MDGKMLFGRRNGKVIVFKSVATVCDADKLHSECTGKDSDTVEKQWF
jgi:hypothetical protein